MITKKQAEILADQIVQDSKPSISRPAKLSRQGGWLNLLASIAIIAAIVFGSREPGWLLTLLIGIFACVFMLTSVVYRKPIFEIDGANLIYRELWPRNTRIIPIDEIVKITFAKKISFLRSARMILIQTNSEEIKIWLYSSYKFQVPQVDHFFKANFRSQFIES